MWLRFRTVNQIYPLYSVGAEPLAGFVPRHASSPANRSKKRERQAHR